ncbi:MAG: prepilin-type N-terminal cleavage/methylation domain-containing protein [Rhodocyclaceae bacterium]
MTTARGFTLVELMIAMVIGLIALMGVINIMSMNRMNYRTTDALSELQENARTAFELLARDIRQAGDTGCGTIDVLPSTAGIGSGWWQDWNPLVGFDGGTSTAAVTTGTGAAARLAGTHAIQVQGTENGWPILAFVPASSDDSPISTLAGNPFRQNDVVMVCDFQAGTPGALFVVQNSPAGGTSVVVNPTGALNFETNGQLARYYAATWYVGDNGRPADGGRSLYRVRYVQGTGASPADGSRIVTEELLPGVSDMQFRFRLQGSNDFVAPATIGTDWDQVSAVEVTLVMWTTQADIATEAGPSPTIGPDRRLQRTFVNIINLRNREQ